MQIEPPDETSAELRERVEKFENEARKQGVYFEHWAVATAGEDDEAHTHVMVTAIVGEQAFVKRVADPEAHEEDQEFRALTAGVDPAEVVRQQMEKNVREGRDPMDDGD